MSEDNPQQQLARMLAQNATYADSIQSMRDRAVNQIPDAIQDITGQLEELRDKIRSQGVGANQKDEQRYLGLLHDRQVIDQIYGMNPPAFNVPPSLRKAIAYGELLLDVYSGALKKSTTAQSEIETYGRLLIDSGVKSAVKLGEKLLRL